MVYKGCQRKMIMIKNPGGDYFEEAYFILKEKKQNNNTAGEGDMIKEANRIVGENMISLYDADKKRKGQNLKYAVCCIMGALSGAGIAALFMGLTL